MTPRTCRALLLGALAASVPSPAAAHEIPARVAVRAFVRPEGPLLRVIVRVPLAAMRDVDFPLRGRGFLDLARAGPELRNAVELWIAGSLAPEEDGRPLGPARIAAVQLSFPSDRSFEGWDEALAHVTGPALPPETDLVWQQALLDAVLEYPITNDRAQFALRPALARLGQQTTTVLRFLPVGSPERAYEYAGDPGLVRLDPRWHQAALQFVKLGFRHILDGVDHLLFLLCLVIPFRRFRPLVLIVTGFTVAHSITLVAATLGIVPSALWFPPLIEWLIALSIVFMAFENIVGARIERRWMLAFGFGLVHGFGFSFALRESLQFAGAHLAMSLFSFNVGVELGQLLVVAFTVPVLSLVLQRLVPERIGIILLSALVAHSAWHWTADRWTALRAYRFEWPVLDAGFFADALRLAMVAVVAGGAAWLVSGAARRFAPRPENR